MAIRCNRYVPERVGGFISSSRPTYFGECDGLWDWSCPQLTTVRDTGVVGVVADTALLVTALPTFPPVVTVSVTALVTVLPVPVPETTTPECQGTVLTRIQGHTVAMDTTLTIATIWAWSDAVWGLTSRGRVDG